MATQRLQWLDFLRGLSILLVLGAHCPAQIFEIPFLFCFSPFFEKFGGYGVDIFFAISGFLIGGDLIHQKISKGAINIKLFYLRRYLKILPPFYICLVCNIFLCIWFSKEHRGDYGVWKSLIPAFFNIQNYFPSTSVFAWFWSLAVEEHFYLILPFLISSMNFFDRSRMVKQMAVLSLLVLVFCFLMRALAWHEHPVPNGYFHKFPTHLRFDGLLIGVFVATLSFVSLGILKGLFLFPLSIALFVLAAFPFKDGPFEFLFTSMGSGILVFLVGRMDFKKVPIRFFRPVSYIGKYTYSIYLWHGFLAAPLALRCLNLFGFQFQETGLSSLLHMALYFLVSISIGILMYWLIEFPTVKIRNKII